MVEKEDGAKDIQLLPIDKIDMGVSKRSTFSPDRYAGLVNSIKKRGMKIPIRVRPMADGRYLLTLGERRLLACKDAGQDTIKAEVDVREPDEAEEMLDWIDTNDDTDPLNDMDRAEAYVFVMNMKGWSQSDLAREIAVPQPTINRLVQLTKDSVLPELKEAVREGKIPATTADHIRQMSPKKQPEEIQKAIAGNLTRAEAVKARRSANNPTRSEEPEPAPELFFSDAWTTDKHGKVGGCTIRFEGRKGKKLRRYSTEEILAEFQWVMDNKLSPKKPEEFDAGEDAGPTILPLAS